MPTLREDLRDELTAAVNARRELSVDHEQYLVESFLDRLDRDVDARIEARVRRRPIGPGSRTAVAIVALVVGAPLSIPIAFAGWPALLVLWAALLAVIYLTGRAE